MICCRFRRLDFGKTILAGICPYFVVNLHPFAELLEIMRRCDVCRLALNNEGYPYIVPMNFGLSVDEDKISLIFHSALEGMKLDLIRKDNRASF